MDRVLRVVENIKTLESNGREQQSITALEGATRAYVSDWGVLDGSDGRTPEPFFAMGDLWARIMLRRHAAAKPIPPEVVNQLETWDRAVQGHEVYEFGAAVEAALHGFESPLLVEDHEDDVADLDRDAYRRAMVGDRLGLAAEEVRAEGLVSREGSRPSKGLRRRRNSDTNGP